MIVRATFNSCKIVIKIVIIGGILYYLYNIRLFSFLYSILYKSINKIEYKNFKWFFNKNKNKKRFPFIIKESLNGEIPIEIVIDDNNLNYLRFKKYGTLTISLVSWLISKLSKETLNDDFNSKLKDSIITECLNNGWFKNE